MSIEDKVTDEAAKLAPEVYKDLVQPAAKEVGDVTGRSVKALLSPVRAFLWGWEQIEAIVIDGVNKRLGNIPSEKRKTPEPEIAVPLIQALSYTAQNETLREMYLNLLANSMNSDMNKDVHPSFVELIKKMSSLDAKVFERLSNTTGYQKAIDPNISIKDKGKFFPGAAPEWFVGWKLDGYDIFEISSSIIRLSKFGLVELMFDRTAGQDTYDELKSNKELILILQKYQNTHPALELEVSGMNSILYVNEYGQQFKKACR